MGLDPNWILVTGLILLSSIYFVFVKWRWSKTEKKTAPEAEGAWSIIGHLHLLSGGDELLHKKLAVMSDKKGPAFTLRFGSRAALVVSTVEVAKECFTTNDRAFASRPATTGTKLMCYNHAVFGFAPGSPYVSNMRKIVVSELLSNRRLGMLKEVQADEISSGLRNIYNSWAENGSKNPARVVLKQWLNDLILTVIVKAVAGKNYSLGLYEEEKRLCQSAINRFFNLMGAFVVSDAFPSLWWLDIFGHEKAMKKTWKDLDDILSSWVDEHRRRKDSGEPRDESNQDFIDLMLLSEEKGQLSGFQFDSDTCIKSTCLAIISGGSDTIAAAMGWAVSLLLNNRDVLIKAREELDQNIGKERQVNDSDIKNLVYLQAIIKETMRLYPVAPLSGPRECVEDCRVSGFFVPAGTRLILNLWKIHRDPKVWERPSEFKPERFLTSHVDVDVRGLHYELTPFGSGRKSCPGIGFALQALHLLLARLIHGFEFTTPMDQPVDMVEDPGLIMHTASPLELLFTPRLPANVY